MFTLYKRLERFASSKILWFLFGFILLFNLVLLKPGFVDKDEPVIEVSIMDTKTSLYTAEDVYAEFDNATPYIADKIRMNAIYDMLYIITYYFFWSMLLIKIYKNGKHENWLPGILWFTLLMSIADLLETSSEFIIIDNIPKHLDGLANAMGYFTIIKWILVAIVLLLVIYGTTIKLISKKEAPA